MIRTSLTYRIFKLFAMLAIFVFASVPAVAGETFTNFAGMTFLSIPAGSFKMGAVSKTAEVSFDELPQHTVSVAAFEIMTTEVTLGQYKRYIMETGKVDILDDEFMNANAHGDKAPVVFVSWHDIRYFLQWLNQNKPSNDEGEYMLPTEAEWEYACHAGTNDLYCGNAIAREVAWYAQRDVTHAQPVAQKKANAFGLYDMSGNVREWVNDCYHNDYVNAPTTAKEWSGLCDSSTRVTRGGAWNEGPEAARATDRLETGLRSRTPSIGFRVVRKTVF